MLKIAFHNPYPTTINAFRTIANWFKYAFEDMWYEFRFFTPDDDFYDFFSIYNPDIFITATHFLYQKQLDNSYLLKQRRERWMVVFCKLDFWNLPSDTAQGRISEAWSMCNNQLIVKNIQDWLIWDIFFHVIEQWDKRMSWFERVTWYKYYTIPLAVDKSMIQTKYKNKYKADISFIWTNSPDKRISFNRLLFPLAKYYDIKLYWQDWNPFDKFLWWIQRWGQYFNIPFLKSIRKPKLNLQDEGDIYHSSKIAINIHEKNQKDYGWDCNERTFKIPAFWWFQVVDNVDCISKYFKDGEEVVIAKNEQDWYDKINYYMNHPEERERIILAWRKRSLEDHTYHNRVELIIKLYNEYVS